MILPLRLPDDLRTATSIERPCWYTHGRWLTEQVCPGCGATSALAAQVAPSRVPGEES